ncbi:hypothetical protein ACB035_20495, partial [Aeromonas sp. S12(2024)]|uniref:hypothetical protein n=1 Tax=Aeromonas sp. S12(2024) TaxID=3242885 RepID=UPI00352813AF
DGTHSCYNSAEKVFYKGRYDFDARGMRRNDTLSGWPAGKTLAAAFQNFDGSKYLMWNDHTHSLLSTTGGVGAVQSTGDWSFYPTGSKRLVAACLLTDEWFVLFWADGTHSGYAKGMGFARDSSSFDSSGYRPNSHYGLPTTKTVCAADYLGGENSFRVFWHDGTHSQIEGSLVTNRDGFDAQGYRSNSA